MPGLFDDLKQPTAKSSGPLDDLATSTTPGSSGLFAGIQPEEKKKGAVKNVFGFIGKQLAKPGGALSEIYQGTGEGIAQTILGNPGAGIGKFATGIKEAGQVLSGKRETSFSEKLRDSNQALLNSDSPFAKGFAVKSPTAQAGVGLLSDIVLDPINLVGGGLTKAGKVASKVDEVRKAGRFISTGSELGKDITKLGLRAEDVSLAATKAEQAAKGQRALFTIAGKPVVRGEKVYKTLEPVTQALRSSKVGTAVRKTFTSKTDNAAFDALRSRYKDLEEYRVNQAVQFGKTLKSEVSKLPEDQIRLVIRAVEDPSTLAQAPKEVADIANTITGKFSEIVGQENAAGVIKDTIENYFPRIRSEKMASGMFQNAREFSSNLGAANRRTIGELFDQSGNSLGITDIKSKGLSFARPGSAAEKAGFDVVGKNGELFKLGPAPIEEINKAFGKEFFKTDPAVAVTTRLVGSAKAVTGAEFLKDVRRFAVNGIDNAVGVTAKGLGDLKFQPEVAAAIDKYVQSIKPEEINTFLRIFDTVQNYWKGQALISPSYHVRNAVGNFWNNFLAGVVDPKAYSDAALLVAGKADNLALTTANGERLVGSQILEEAKKLGVLDQGLFSKDIEDAIDIGSGTWKLWKQNNKLFKANRAAGEAIEGNARMAHFVDRIRKGDTLEQAAASVKKYLFDYGDLSGAEKNIFKRVAPFYTWTRKNVPLQISELVKQPEKFALIDKFARAIEGNVQEPDEKYLSDYIKSNIPIRITNKDGVTSYFLLGQWLPAAQAIDFLSQPVQSTVGMITPFLKTPFELLSNKSTFFKNTLGEYDDIEARYMEEGSFLGLSMRKKVINVLQNIRLLNELDKLNPFDVWGTKDKASVWSKIFGEQAANIGLFNIGPITTSPQRGISHTPDSTGVMRTLNAFVGKTVPYEPFQAKYFYDRDTENRIQELQRSADAAQYRGQTGFSGELMEQLRRFEAERR